MYDTSQPTSGPPMNAAVSPLILPNVEHPPITEFLTSVGKSSDTYTYIQPFAPVRNTRPTNINARNVPVYPR